jgi:hypothetical protein
MKAMGPPRIKLPRAMNDQELLRLFAAGAGANVPENLRYLAFPSYHVTASGPVTVAGDGKVFLWTRERVPGFADYKVPPTGFGYFELPQVWRIKGPSPQTPCPPPAGAWGSRQADAVWIGQHPARINRWILARLSALHSCWIGGAERWDDKGTTGWRVLRLRGNFGTRHYEGVIFCEEPEAVQRERRDLTNRKWRAGAAAGRS